MAGSTSGIFRYDTVAKFKRGARVKVDERVIVGALERLVVEGLLVPETQSPLPDALPAGDAELLETRGGVTDNREALLAARIEHALRTQTLNEQTFSVAEVAALLKLSESRVRHRIQEGSLYAFPARGRGTSRRLPTWQFENNEPIPHLGEVLGALPDDFNPIEVRNFILNARIDQPNGDGDAPLLEWLRGGGDVEPVLEVARTQAEVL